MNQKEKTQKENNLLLLFTSSYPYGDVAESFLDSEIPFLSRSFDKVVLIPQFLPTLLERVNRELPENIEIEDSLLNEQLPLKGVRNKISLALNAFISTDFYREILSKPEILFRISLFKSSVIFFGNAVIIKRWLQKYIETHNFDFSTTVFYTYWLSLPTSGVSMVKKKIPSIKIVSRAHGLDLYSERHVPPYIPHRPEVFQYLNRLYLISDHGRKYVLDKYPMFEDICKVYRLGVNDLGFLTEASSDGIFRIVSCSYLVPVKRIDLLIQALAELGKIKSSRTFEWTHIGYGILQKDLQNLADSLLPKNVIPKFIGHLPNKEVIAYYQNNCVDVFVNVSASEGIPVSIMEAQSCGIPVIATAVGGTPEIVSNEVGVLLSENPSPREIAEAICSMMENEDEILVKRINSRDNWENNYNSNKNFEIFVQDLKKL